MNQQYIEPFKKSLISTMEMMLGIEALPGDHYIKGEDPTPGTICGMIGLAGEHVHGAVALYFEAETVIKIYEMMTGEVVEEVDHEVADIISELANIVAGNGKTAFANKKESFDITIPSVVIADSINISYGPDSEVLVIPGHFDDQEFFMELMFKVI